MPALDSAPRRTVALVLAGALLPVAGCSASPDDESSGRGAGGAAMDIRQTGRSRVASGGTLRWAVDELPRTLNAFRPDAGTATDRIAGATLPALFDLDEKGRPRPDPDYLRSAGITATEPRQTVVYKLNPKAEWSDGRAIGLEDFVSQWRALNGSDSDYPAARNAGYHRIGKITAGKEPHSVEVTFTRPYADWESLFSPLYPKDVTHSPGAFTKRARNSLPVSGGPFRAEEPDEESGTVRLVRNPEWWGDRAKLDAIELKAVPRTEREEALASGELDLAEVGPRSAFRISTASGRSTGKDGGARPAAETEEAEEAPGTGRRDAPREGRLSGYTLRKALGPSSMQLTLNGGSGPLADEKVRRAVARTLDREELARRALGRTGLPEEPLGSHLRVTGQDGYRDNSSALGGKDLEGARSLLADAGWTDGTPQTPDDGKKGTDDGRPGHGAPGEDGVQAGPEQPPHRVEAEKAVAPVGAAEAERIAGRPLGIVPSSEGQRAALLLQAAHLRQQTAREGGSGRAVKQAEAELEGARAARTRADELRLLAGGEAAAVRRKDGRPLALRFVLPAGPGSGQTRATGERIAQMLNAVGIRTRIEKVPNESYFRSHVASGEFDLALFSWPASAYPATDAAPAHAKPEVRDNGLLRTGRNFSRVGTDRIDQLFEQARSELDDETRRDLLAHADARIWAAAGSVPLYQSPQLVAVEEGLVNAGAFGLGTPRYQDIGYAK